MGQSVLGESLNEGWGRRSGQIWRCILLTIFLAWLPACASSPGSSETGDNPSATETTVLVVGSVLMPDSTPVSAAEVWTEPATTVVRTNDLGHFRFDDPLEPGIYQVFAQLGNLRGVTLYRVEDERHALQEIESLMVVLGRNRISPRIHPDSILVAPRPLRGRVRVDGQ